jgi:hypothetical protein
MFLIYVFIVLYFGYNFIQVAKEQMGRRFESPFLLLLVAAPLDLFKKIFKK